MPSRRPPPEPEPTQPRDTLLSAVCHDLRAPLAAVQMGTSFVLQTTPESAENDRVRKILGAVLRSCAQMDRLLRNFSDLSHLEAGDVSLDLSEQDARTIAELAVEPAREAAAARRVKLVLSLPERAVPLRCDRDRLIRGLAQLVDNAVRHGPEAEEVTVTVQGEEATAVRFEVADRGPGLPDEVRAHLFDRHWHSTRTGRPGAGLGLAIARGVAVLHGGDLAAEAPPGGPTRFVLRVPSRPAPP